MQQCNKRQIGMWVLALKLLFFWKVYMYMSLFNMCRDDIPDKTNELDQLDPFCQNAQYLMTEFKILL